MFDVSLQSALLAAADEPGFIAGLFSTTWLWVKVALGIGLVVFVHELGHFLAAKFFGVKCEKFYVGFDVPIQLGPIKLPRTLGKFQYGETEYGIGILPLGGYVKMLGQDDDPRNAEKEAERIKLEGGDADAIEYDPRSFPAKPVWQRMIIISAGVIVNVVTGIMFAAMAYGFGVPYQPAIVGGVTPGGSAWEAGVQPGGEVVAVADLQSEDQLHFQDMMLKIMEASLDDPELPVAVKIRYGATDGADGASDADGVIETDYQLMTKPVPSEPDRRMIGVTSPAASSLQADLVAFPGSAASKVLDDDMRGATFTEVDGVKIDGTSDSPLLPLKRAFLAKADQEVAVTLQPVEENGSPKAVTIPPQPMQGFGVTFRPGPITAIMVDSPAEKAGVKVGDVITSVNGDENVDAYRFVLQSSLSASWEQPIELTVRRGKGENAETVSFTLTADSNRGGMAPVSELASDIASAPLGIALQPTAVFSRVDDSLNRDGRDKIAVGDELKEVRAVWKNGKLPEALESQLSEQAIIRLNQGWDLDSPGSINALVSLLQFLPEGTEFEAFVRRGTDSRVLETTLTVNDMDGVFWFRRGLALQRSEAIQTARSVGQAVSLGLREGGRRLNDVVGFLGLLVQGKIKAKFVGGPIRIVEMAGVQARQGVSKQLLFLTMLSMNLAILNFLPIPALDGGHMMFLTAELVRGKRVDEQLEMKLTLAGVLAILSLMIFVFANDIFQITR